MDKTNFFSIYSLINNLCENLIIENNSNKCINLTDVRKLRIQAFGILLKKYKHKTNSKNYADPLKELDIINFTTRIKSKNNATKKKNCEEFERLLNDVSTNVYFVDGYGNDVLIFLLFVKDSIIEHSQYENEFHMPLLVPGPFTLHLEYTKSLSYPLNEIKYSPGRLEHFNGLNAILDYNNPYLPRFLFEKTKTDAVNNKTFKCAEKKQKKPISYQFLKFALPILNIKSIENKNESEANKLNFEHFHSPILQSAKRFGWNWENLGTTSIQTEKKFGSELGTSTPFWFLINENLGRNFKAKIISIESFLADLKSLLVGIESESFFLDENINFHMAKNLTVFGIIPTILKNFLDECLECGTCYKRMQIMILKKNFQLMFEGFIFKALCCAIEDYIVIFGQFVFSHDDSKLLEFYERMKKPIRQISSLSYILTIHPKVKANVKPPTGSQFLGYIYKEIMRITESDMLSLLVFILRRCCHVYFKYLQKWIFLGNLDDPSNELFICFVDYYHPNTKYYFDKAYFIRKESVPGFFQGYEDYILQCGKYTMLLKAFNPNHPIFSIEYPSIRVCLSFYELKQIEDACDKYLHEALQVCSPPITIQDIYNNNVEKKKHFFKLVQKKSQKNLEKFNLEKSQLSNSVSDKKRKYFEEICERVEEKRVHNIKEKMKNISLERELNKQQQRKEKHFLCIDYEQTSKRIEYLEELNSLVDVGKNDKTKLTLSESTISTDSKFELYGKKHIEVAYKDNKTENKFNTKFDFRNIVANANTFPEFKFNKTENDILNSNEIHGDIEKIENKSITTKTDIENKNFTEAKRNKLKVLGSEYYIFDTVNKDLNYNSLENRSKIHNSELNIMQKNKIKMMQTNPFEPLNSKILNNTFDLNLITEESRNRKKMLESQFQLFFVESINSANTPMSTSSDSILEDEFFETENTESRNSNINVENINIDAVYLNYNKKCDLAIPEKEINYVNKNESQSDQNELTLNNNFIHLNDKKNNIKNENIELSYGRCINLIKNNFKSKPTTGLIQLKNITRKLSGNNDNEKIKEIINKQCNLNSLSMITLTEFLQKSLILPLRAHLQIMNNEVMRVFLVDLNLIGHFKSLRNYFLLMNGEFSSIICDELIGKLEEGTPPIEFFNYQTLHSILDKAIGCSNFGSDKNSDKLSFIVSDIPNKFDLTSPSVISNLCLSYSVTWPLNLILNPETLDKYGDIFKYLFKVRRISWVLEQSFRILKQSVKSSGNGLLMSPQYRRAQLIRHKFFHFVHALRNHITAGALQASWKEFKDNLLKAKCVEEIYRKHATYIKKILFLCMLNKSSVDFYKSIENIFRVVLRFYRNLKSREWTKKYNEEYYTHPRFEKLLVDELEFEKLVKYVIYLGNKIVKRGYQEEIGQLINLVNYNQYYLTCA